MNRRPVSITQKTMKLLSDNMNESYKKDYHLIMGDLHDYLPKDGVLERTIGWYWRYLIEEHYHALVSGYFEEDQDRREQAILFLRKARQTLESFRDMERLIVIG